MDRFNRKSFDSEGAQFAWDGTSLELASTCLRKYYYANIANIKPRNQSVHLIFGGIYATALEHFYLYRAQGDSINDALRKVVREALVLSWKHELTEDGERILGSGEPVSFDHAAKTRSNLIRSIVWYVDQFGVESEDGIRTYHLADGKPAVELSFALEFTDDLFYCGHLDRVVHYGSGLYWMDQKTTGSTISQRFFDSFKPSNQFLGYTWAGQALLKSPIKGGVIDGAQIAVGFTRFERAPITFTQEQIEEWYDSALYHINAARAATKAHNYPMNLSACGNYGGCPYRELCSRSPSVRERFIEGDYVHPEQAWDPLVPR